MNKYFVFILITMLSLSLVSCNKDDVKPIDLHLMDGVWEVVYEGNQDVFIRGCYLEISTSFSPDDISYGGTQRGRITTFFLTATGIAKHDKVYDWYVSGWENDLPLLELVYQGDLDSDDIWDGNYFYKITKLTDTHMWWQVRTNGDNSTIKLRRRTDVTAE